MADKYAISFHESFSLSRVSLSYIIKDAGHSATSYSELSISALGTNYQKAMPRYAWRAGLLDEQKQLTDFGRFAVQYDPGLEKLSTQWLLHYHLAAPHGHTAFWHYLVRKRFLPGNTFTADDLVNDLSEFMAERAGKVPAPRSIRSTVTVFLGTYLKEDGLKRLGLIETEGFNAYRVLTPPAPPLWAIGYALADYWNAHYDGRLSINMDDLIEGDFAAIFLLGEERFMQLLLQLKQEGMLDLYRISRPYQVVLLQPNLEYALQRLYSF